MSNNLNIIVGAGFSYYAGLPLGIDIKNKFDQALSYKLIKATSSEWLWADGQSDALVNDGQLSSDHLEYAFIMEEIVKAFKVTNDNQFSDYEDFYQYVKDNTFIDGWYEQIIASAKQRFYSETNCKDMNSENYGLAFRYPQRNRPQEIINYLIADMLGIKKTEKELMASYKPFIQYIQKYDSVNIFSLNHDRVFEWLFKLFEINYCDGFSAINSNLKYEDKFLRNFQNEFNSANIKLLKLHGSIDMYLYEHGTEEGAMLTRNGECSYFKPGGYQEKHHAERVDLTTGQVVQHMNFDIIPKFITGKNKIAFIESDYMYTEMYKSYKKQMVSGNDLLIVGYSYRDEHVNEEIKNFTKTSGQKIINLNYGDKFPFTATLVTEIKQFSELM